MTTKEMTTKELKNTELMNRELTNTEMTNTEFQPDFSTLPDLVLFKIFEFVKGPRELKRYQLNFAKRMVDSWYSYSREFFNINGQYGSILDVRLVCKKFHDLAWDRRLLTELRIHPQISIRDLIQAIEERPLIEELIINFSRCAFEKRKKLQLSRTSWEDHPDAVFQLIKTLTKLKTLKIVGAFYRTKLDPVFFEAFESSKETLTKLHLEDLKLTKGFNLENLRSFANINSLKLRDSCSSLSMTDDENVGQEDFLVENLPKLEELNTIKLHVIIRNSSPLLHRLRRLDLGDYSHVDKDTVDAIEKFTSLEELKLSDCATFDPSIPEELVEKLKEKAKIKIEIPDRFVSF